MLLKACLFSLLQKLQNPQRDSFFLSQRQTPYFFRTEKSSYAYLILLRGYIFYQL